MRSAMKGLISIIAALATASLIAFPGSVRAHGGGHGGGGHGGGGHTSGGHPGGSHSGSGHSGSGHQHHYGYGAVIAGGALLYPWPYSYGYYPQWDYLQPAGPVFYVEQFTGMPTPETAGWIYCPAEGASYPDVAVCPGGWQRVFTPEQVMGQFPAPQPSTVTP